MNYFSLLTIPLAPLMGSIATGFLGRIIGKRASHYVAIFTISISFLFSIKLAISVSHFGHINQVLYEWLKFDLVSFEVGFLIDRLTTWMVLIVTSISLMVHIYAIEYMSNDDSYQRFFSYISFFTFAMLVLVMSNNFIQLFFAWEIVGFISYLLIGFWYKKTTALYAATKAFLINRIGDLSFLLGIGLIFFYTGSLNYEDIFKLEENLYKTMFLNTHVSVLTVSCFCLFIAAMTKSAQFPLHIWLPDSMEGPTPVSALIHAATMVTAGIFMIARMSPLFYYCSDTLLSLIMLLGSITALLMGIMGIVQTDIKRIIAYSTLSQLGYMTAALGVSAYSFAIFHLITHAFFKALLFLSAGSVILGMHHNQDIKKMGGLFKYMPITWFTFLIGSLSLIGAPFLSGFYSKESIIEVVGKSKLFGSQFSYFLLLISIFVTSIYTFRMFFLIFHGKPRFDFLYDEKGNIDFPRESSWFILFPLLVLTIPSALFGMFFAFEFIPFEINSPNSIIYLDTSYKAVENVIFSYNGVLSMAIHSVTRPAFWLSLLGVVSSWWVYLKDPKLSFYIAGKCKSFLKILYNKYYLDYLVDKIFVQGILKFSYKFWQCIDVIVIEGVVKNLPSLILRIATNFHLMHTGFVYHYIFAMSIAVIIFFLFPLYALYS